MFSDLHELSGSAISNKHETQPRSLPELNKMVFRDEGRSRMKYKLFCIYNSNIQRR